MRSQAEEEASEEYEQRLLKIDECFLYKVPPLKQAVGHRAESWGLGNPLLTARLEIIGKGQVLEIRIYDEKDQQVARCPVRCGRGTPPVEVIVDAVVDSSRYFVLRCEDDRSRHAYVGLGFRERDYAFNFKASIFDFKAKIDRETKAISQAQKREADCANITEHEADVYNTDLALKGPIKISLGPRHTSDTKPTSTSRTPFTLKPPPPSHISPAKIQTQPPQDDNDDFGDFEQAPSPAV